MVKEYSRTQRVSEQIKRELAQIIHREVKDPRIGMVTLSDVEVTTDLSYAKVYFTTLNIDSDLEKDPSKLLNKISPMLRSLLGKKIRLRVTPELKFIYDNSLTEGMRISNLVSKVIKKDNNLK
ncbi:ribosome-binding factor A [Paraphotobacterium marinum]|uniref:Ribosome-binding factor A n=1 Tax=Paraphotobacterium marinum TaxID=1755811 RepID=A0A220VD89_9GAMM|nr:30S ribosome-binding factor RbfA [Paraphotobacterium marinum]ASK78378.1 ribosome-binding factor A [Paraphotobacterium marinum]